MGGEGGGGVYNFALGFLFQNWGGPCWPDESVSNKVLNDLKPELLELRPNETKPWPVAILILGQCALSCLRALSDMPSEGLSLQ